MYFAARANLNTGVIVTIWSVTPLFMAICDYFIFDVKLKCYHYIGLVSIIIMIIVLCLTHVINPMVPGQQSTSTEWWAHPIYADDPYNALFKNEIPAFIAVIFGIVTPVCFTA